MQPETVKQALEQFSLTEACQTNPRLPSNLRCALRRYILPVYGFTEAELRSHLDDCLAKLPLSEFFSNATQLLENLNPKPQDDSKKKTKIGTLNNYRSALLRFFNWMYAQDWYNSATSIPIEKYAPQIYSGKTLSKAKAGRKPHNANPYALKEKELNPVLVQQLEQLHHFWTHPEVALRKAIPIRELTSIKYRKYILCILGWLHHIQGQALIELNLEQVTDIEQLQAFINWGQQQKGNGSGWAVNIVLASLSVAKWLDSISPQKDSAVKALQDYLQALREDYQQESSPPKSNIENLTFSEAEEIVQYLKQCCAPFHTSGISRSETALLKSWQRYLITALLVYCPIRPIEITQLEWQHSLIREPERYRLRLAASKSNKKQTVFREFFLSEHLTQDLDTWRQQWRPKIPTDNNLVFVRLGSSRTPNNLGQPLTPRDLSELISKATYKATSVLFDAPRHLSPHAFCSTTINYLEQIGRAAQNRTAAHTQRQIPQLKQSDQYIHPQLEASLQPNPPKSHWQLTYEAIQRIGKHPLSSIESFPQACEESPSSDSTEEDSPTD